MAQRRVLRWSRLVTRWLMAATATLLLLFGLLVWRVAQGPVSLGFMVPYLTEALTLADRGVSADVSDVVLAWSEEENSLRLRLYDVRYRAVAGGVAMRVPTIDMSLSGRALLRGVIAPRYLHVSGVRARIVRGEDGSFRIGVIDAEGDDETADAPSGTVPAPSAAEAPGEGAQDSIVSTILTALFEDLSGEPNPNRTFGELETVSVTAERLVIFDRMIGERLDVPQAQVVFQRGTGHVFATATGRLDWRDKEVNLRVLADYTRADRSARIETRFDNVDPSDFADVVPELAPLDYLDAPLGGSVTMILNESGQQVDFDFDLAIGAGTIRVPERLAADLQLTEAKLKGGVDANTGLLQIDEASLAFADGFRIGLAGSVQRETPAQDGAERIAIDIRGQLFDMPTDALPHYWPVDVAKNARQWIAAHIRGGTVPAGRFAAKLTPEMVSGAVPVPREAVKLDFAFDGLEVDYLAPMTKLTAASGVATLDAEEMNITVESATVGTLRLGSGRVRLTGLTEKDQHADISSSVQGTAAAVLGLIDQKPLGFPSRFGIAPATAGGDATVKWRVRFPLLNTLKMDDIRVNAEATIADAAVPGLMKGRYALTGGSLSLKVDNTGLVLDGSGAVNGVPLERIGWRQDFTGKARVMALYSLQGRVDEAGRVALGYPLAPYIDGPVAAEIEIEERRGGEVAVGGSFDLADTAIDIADAHLFKPVGEAARGRMQLRTSTGKPTVFDLVEITGERLALTAKATLPPGGGWSTEIASLKYRDGEIAGRLAFAANGDAEINLRGRRWDLRPFVDDVLGGGSPTAAAPADGSAAVPAPAPAPAPAPPAPAAAPAPKPRLVVALRLDEAVVADDGPEMRNLLVEAQRAPTRMERVAVTGGFTSGGGTSIEILPQLGARQLGIRSDNAGAMLNILGVTDMKGGSMTVTGSYDDTKPDQPLSGRMTVQNMRAVNAPFLARLFGAGSFTGLSALLSSEQGILFERGEVPFSQKGRVTTIEPSRFQGPQLGITFEGKVDGATDSINVSGTAVPAFVLNTILGKIPVLGDIFVGDGILGVNFAVSGPTADPQFTINPLSAIAPGFLRRIFQAPTASSPTTNPPADGEAPAERPPGSGLQGAPQQ